MEPDLFARLAFYLLQGWVEYLFDERGLAATANAADYTEDVEREFDGQVPEIVLTRTFHDQGAVPGSYLQRRCDGQFAFEVFTGKAFFIGDKRVVVTRCHYLTAEVAG